MASSILHTPFGSSKIIFDGDLNELLPLDSRCVIITDEHILSIYKDLLSPYEVLTIPRSENCKSLHEVENIVEQLIHLGIGRDDFIIAFGGGAVCDFVGFVSSVYRRGVNFGFVPTSLLAQVDAAIGGKNGVNVKLFKNMIGTFAAPEFVLINPEFTLSQHKEAWLDGFAEIIKHGVVLDESLFIFLRDGKDQILGQNKEYLLKCIQRATELKMSVVSKDPFDKGERMKLNFGHTVGHAIEKELNISHGKAVSVGMVMEARVSEKIGKFSPKSTAMLIELLRDYGLPTHMNFNFDKAQTQIFGDKKGTGDQINIPVLNSIGSCEIKSISNTVLISELKDTFNK